MAEDKTLMRFTGSKVPGDRTRRIILEGTTSDPKRVIDLDGDPVEMTADEVAQWSDRYKLSEATDAQKKALSDKQGDSEQSAAEARAAQQRAQAEAADAQGPGAETSQVSRPKRASASGTSGDKS